jgi:hypothetical protein
MFVASERMSSLNWVEIRRQYEFDGVGAQALARQHDIASVTTIRRKIKAEEWKTPAEREAEAQRTTQYVPPEPVAEPEEPPAPQQPADDESDVEMIPMSEVVAERALHDTAKQIRAETADAGDVMGVHDLAALHTQRIKDQLELSSQVTAAGMRVFAIIGELLDTDSDPKMVERAQAALNKLTNVNPDRDTLAGLLKAAADVVARGVGIERRALGMDVKRRPGAPEDPVPELASPRRPAGNLIKLMDPATAFKLREMVQRQIMERRQNEIAAQVEAE